jgi:ubiquinone/menaquinone biosynthesis C-methylase UbiE
VPDATRNSASPVGGSGPRWDGSLSEETVVSDIHAARLRLAVAWILELDSEPCTHVLDVGCGAGNLALELSGRGLTVDAVDLRPEMVDLVGRRASALGLEHKVSAQVADATSLPFAAASYDVVAALGVLPWVSRPAACLRELARVARPGGHVFVTGMNRLQLSALLDPARNPAAAPLKRGLRTLGVLAETPHPAATYLSLRETERMVREAGLVPLRSLTIGFGPFTFLGRELLAAQRARELNRKLQRLADQGTPALRSAGVQCVVLAARP